MSKIKFKIKDRRKFNYLIFILVFILQLLIFIHLRQIKAENEAFHRAFVELFIEHQLNK